MGLTATFITTFILFAQAEAQDCWAGKRRTDLRSGKIKFECVKEPETWRKVKRLRQIAELGPTAQSEALYVIARLTDEDWEVRPEAARALGLIGDTDAIPQLMAAITPNDWRLTFEAIVSLTRLKAPQAASVLKDVATSYWLPAVAESADDLAAGRPLSKIAMAISIGVPVDYCAGEAVAQKCPIFRDHPRLKKAHQAPLTLDVQGGKLIGTNHGEWGGELGFIDEKSTQTIIEDNVLAIVQRTSRIFVVTGLDHGGLNRGYIWEVTRAGDGQWSAKRLWRLPGTPYEIVTAPDGTIGLFGKFGSVLYEPDDTLQWLRN